MSKRKGYGSRYENDLGGNHIDREAQKPLIAGLFLDHTRRRCRKCNESKPVKGSKKTALGYICADCQALKTK